MSSMLNPAISRSRIFELTSEEWALLFAAVLVTVAGIAAVSPAVTTWSAFGLGFTALVVGHLCMTARRFVAFPDLIVAASCLQWIVAPWLAAQYPSRMVLYHMTLPIDHTWATLCRPPSPSGSVCICPPAGSCRRRRRCLKQNSCRNPQAHPRRGDRDPD
jgi:hypothetical protein